MISISNTNTGLIPVIGAAKASPANIIFLPEPNGDKHSTYPVKDPSTSMDDAASGEPPTWDQTTRAVWLMNAAEFTGHEITKTLHDLSELMNGIIELFAREIAQTDSGPIPGGETVFNAGHAMLTSMQTTAKLKRT